MSMLKREIIMSAKIEYGYEGRREERTITQKMKLENISQGFLEETVKEVILSRLPSDMAHIYGLTVKTRVISTRYGSLTVFFGVILSGLAFIANYKGFFDSMQLIREHLQLLLRGRLHEAFGEEMAIEVSVQHPKLDDPREARLPSELRRFFRHMRPEPEFEEAFGLWQLLSVRRQTTRDAFFWFLLALCVLLVAVVGALVFAAVKKTYFL